MWTFIGMIVVAGTGIVMQPPTTSTETFESYEACKDRLAYYADQDWVLQETYYQADDILVLDYEGTDGNRYAYVLNCIERNSDGS